MKKSIEWIDQKINLIDQTLLPIEKKILTITTIDDLVEAIKSLRIRGAPAIGIAAAYGILISLIEKKYTMQDTFKILAESRPTAVNLFWALEEMKFVYEQNKTKSETLLFNELEKHAILIHKKDQESCEQIGVIGNSLLPDTVNIITICNTGFLATGGIGTALGVIHKAHQSGKNVHVYVTETRPLLQGSRLTAWELKELGIPFTLVTDNMAAHIMRTKSIDCVIAGADRIALNGDSANKIGTYSLAVLAYQHQIPFYIAAPTSTIDFDISSGDDIPIEERNPIEITTIKQNKIAPEQINCYNPAFDVTPQRYINAIITEKRVIRNSDFDTILNLKQE